MTVVRFTRFPIDRVGRVTLWAPYAPALSQSRTARRPGALLLVVLIVAVEAHDAELAAARKAVSHPLELVNELEVAFARTAYRLLVELLDAFDFVLVVTLRQVEQRQKDVQGDDDLAPLFGFALDDVDLDFVAGVEALLDWFGDLLLNTVDASLMQTLLRKYYARVALLEADGAFGVGVCNQLVALYGHALVQLRIDRINLVPIIAY